MDRRYYASPPLPTAFVRRRLHSLTGVWLTLFLLEHLLTNSQAAVWWGEDGWGFVKAVNALHDLPYLPAVEILFLAVPFLMHGWLGISMLRSAEYNSFATDGTTPSLPYPHNRRYTWQRITAWLLIIGVVAHVIHMRFWEAPKQIGSGMLASYFIKLHEDPSLEALRSRLRFEIIDRTTGQVPPSLQKELEHHPLEVHQVIALTPSFGTAELLLVRETFKSLPMVVLYTLFVLIAVFHGCNGLWTAMIRWGITQTLRAQTIMLRITVGLMLLLSFLGLAAIFGSYWWNLRG